MKSLDPAKANDFPPIELRALDIKFFVAEIDGTAVGCAALLERDGYGEIKSMFVDPEARGSGIAARLLACLIDLARAAGLPLLRLETGVGLDAAHRLYERHGFVDGAAFGNYAPNAPFSRYMERLL